MQLKKINPYLQQALIENNLLEANEMQQETFSTIKSGKDAVIQSPPGSGKTTLATKLSKCNQVKVFQNNKNQKSNKYNKSIYW